MLYGFCLHGWNGTLDLRNSKDSHIKWLHSSVVERGSHKAEAPSSILGGAIFIFDSF